MQEFALRGLLGSTWAVQPGRAAPRRWQRCSRYDRPARRTVEPPPPSAPLNTADILDLAIAIATAVGGRACRALRVPSCSVHCPPALEFLPTCVLARPESGIGRPSPTQKRIYLHLASNAKSTAVQAKSRLRVTPILGNESEGVIN